MLPQCLRIKSEDVQTRDEQMSPRCCFYADIPLLVLWVGGSVGENTTRGTDRGANCRGDVEMEGRKGKVRLVQMRWRVMVLVASALFQNKSHVFSCGLFKVMLSHKCREIKETFSLKIFSGVKSSRLREHANLVFAISVRWVKSNKSSGFRRGMKIIGFQVWMEPRWIGWVHSRNYCRTTLPLLLLRPNADPASTRCRPPLVRRRQLEAHCSLSEAH